MSIRIVGAIVSLTGSEAEKIARLYKGKKHSVLCRNLSSLTFTHSYTYKPSSHAQVVSIL